MDMQLVYAKKSLRTYFIMHHQDEYVEFLKTVMNDKYISDFKSAIDDEISEFEVGQNEVAEFLDSLLPKELVQII